LLALSCLPSYDNLILEAYPVLSTPPLHWQQCSKDIRERLLCYTGQTTTGQPCLYCYLLQLWWRQRSDAQQTGRLSGCSPLYIDIEKSRTDSVDIMMSKVLRDLAFSRNHPLKSTDDWYTENLKNKI
jgi:hypothetical protein